LQSTTRINLKKTYFLLHLHTFVYKTKNANAAIKSDILGFLE